MANKIIRTPTMATGGITVDEKTRMDEHTKMWIARAMRTDPIEPDKIIPAIKSLYAAAGLKEPRVVIAPSPLVMAFAYGSASTILNSQKYSFGAATYAATGAAADDDTRAAAYAATYAATNAATYAATGAATDAAIRDVTRTATRAATLAATDDATRAATDDATRAATYAVTRTATRAVTRTATYAATLDATYAVTYAATYAAIKNSAAKACFDIAGLKGLENAGLWYELYQGGNMWVSYECYLTAMRDIIGLQLPENDKYKAWEECAIHGGFRVMHQDFCIVSDFPEILRVDDRNRPHCEFGPSHRWRDGWSLYHWHGVKIPDEWIEDKKSLTAKTALTWENIEQRRAACEILGWNAILTELDAKIIDTDSDPEIGELVEVTIPDIGRERFLRVQCGTGRQFALPVPPEMKTALQAQSWTWGYDDTHEFIKPEVRT